ncbi:MAG: serine hydrolase domain-containing protein [Actinomycetota bacterium]
MADLDAALERIRAFLESRLPAFLDAPGAIVGLTDRERLVGVIPVGQADAFTGAPVRDDSRFEIGSISKSFAALIALQEVERGTLDLFAPVTEYVPWFRLRSDYGAITTHHLLTHASGLIMGMDFADDAVPAVESLARTSTGFAPGERFHYSNDGYKLVGLILERVTGSSIRALLRDRVFTPLGMGRTDPAITYETRKDVATGHQRINEDRPPHRGMPLIQAPPIVSTTADGSIISPAADMAAYARMLLNHGRTDAGEALIGEASFERFTRPVIDIPEQPGMAYAYGLDVLEADGHAFVRHSGGMVGYYALLECDMDAGVGAIMMVNGHADRNATVRFALQALRAWKEETDLPETPPAPDPYSIPAAAEVAGRYRSGTREITLHAAGERLMLSVDGTGVALEPDVETPETFAVPHPELDRFALTLDRRDGEVIALISGPDRFVRDGEPELPAEESPAEWEAITGLYRAYNPWFPAFRVYVRGGRLFLSGPEGEEPLEDAGGGEFRVGEAWSPDRVSFGTVLDGCARVATYNAHPFWRSFEE